MPHVSLPGHHPGEGGPNLFPPVHDVSLQVLGADHQDRFPGCHVETVGAKEMIESGGFGWVKLLKKLIRLFHFI